MLIATLSASLVGNMLAWKGINKARDKIIKACYK